MYKTRGSISRTLTDHKMSSILNPLHESEVPSHIRQELSNRGIGKERPAVNRKNKTERFFVTRLVRLSNFVRLYSNRSRPGYGASETD
jgi:hypothetical protein